MASLSHTPLGSDDRSVHQSTWQCAQCWQEQRQDPNKCGKPTRVRQDFFFLQKTTDETGQFWLSKLFISQAEEITAWVQISAMVPNVKARLDISHDMGLSQNSMYHTSYTLRSIGLSSFPPFKLPRLGCIGVPHFQSHSLRPLHSAFSRTAMLQDPWAKAVCS